MTNLVLAVEASVLDRVQSPIEIGNIVVVLIDSSCVLVEEPKIVADGVLVRVNAVIYVIELLLHLLYCHLQLL